MMFQAFQRAIWWAGSAFQKLRSPVLAAPLTRSSGNRIDEALKKSEMAWENLFRVSHAIAQHRHRMAQMLTIYGIDVDQAVKDQWNELKAADEACAACLNTGRYRRWLEWVQPNAASEIFCPNAERWLTIAEEQSGGPSTDSKN